MVKFDKIKKTTAAKAAITRLTALEVICKPPISFYALWKQLYIKFKTGSPQTNYIKQIAVIYGHPNNLLKKFFSHHRYLNAWSKANSGQKHTNKSKKENKQMKKTQR